MNKLLLIISIYVLQLSSYSQNIPFQYSVRLKPITVENLPGIHSYAFAQSNGKWLIIGGRTDGIHARQPFASFPVANNNTTIYVIDILTKQFWSSNLSSLSISLQEQLQSTNMNFYQDADTLFLIGGYGYSHTQQDHITYPNLTSVQVSGLINAIITNNPIQTYFKQITDQNFAVNGGHLGKIGESYYLIGGHRFDGRYNPMSNPTYTQTYTNAIKKFRLNNSGTNLNYTHLNLITDQVHLHRRDYNLVPQVFSNNEEGYTLSSGVFQVSANLPFLYPVDIKASGYIANTSFNQYLSNYHSANVGLFDSIQQTMHSLFFGGMSQYYYSNGTLIQDVNVPFVKTISRVSRDSSGNLQETAFTNEMPAYNGASSEFIINEQLAHYSNEVIKLSQVHNDSVIIGHIYGGILSNQINPFTNNTTSSTSAGSNIFEVWLIKQNHTSIREVNGKNPVRFYIFPNPTKNDLHMVIHAPYASNLHLHITTPEGKLVLSETFDQIQAGENKIDFNNHLNLIPGTYFFNIVFDNKFSGVEKVLLKE